MEFFYTKSFSVTDAQKNSGVIHGKMKLNSKKIYQMFLLRARYCDVRYCWGLSVHDL